jgi:hypothetical protein
MTQAGAEIPRFIFIVNKVAGWKIRIASKDVTMLLAVGPRPLI